MLYNVPGRVIVNMPAALLTELAQIPSVVAVKQANDDELAPIPGLELLAGNDTGFLRTLQLGGAGGILVASHVVGDEMRQIWDLWQEGREEEAAALDARLAPAYEAMGVVVNPIPVKACLEMAGICSSADAPADGRSNRIRKSSNQGPSGQGRGDSLMTDKLKLLPLGGVGEIGKNMMVAEYRGKIVVIDTGLMFPTPEMLGIDLVLPDFEYLRGRADDIEAIVLTHGHEDHVGALPYVLREIGFPKVIYGGLLTVGMVRSKLDEHKLGSAPLTELPAGQVVQAGPFSIELVHLSHSIPDMRGVVLGTDLGNVFFTGDYKFDQTPVDGRPADVARLARLGSEGLLALFGDSTNADRPGVAPSESSVGPALYEAFAGCKGRIIVTSFASNIHRVQQVIDAAARLDRKVALVGRSMRKNFNIASNLGMANAPDGMLIQPREIE